MSIWTEFAKRERRRRQVEAANQWLVAHPRQAFFLSLGISILILEIAMFLEFGLEAISKRF